MLLQLLWSFITKTEMRRSVVLVSSLLQTQYILTLGFFRDLIDFRGQPLGNNYGCLKKNATYWMRHAMREQQVEVTSMGTTFF